MSAERNQRWFRHLPNEERGTKEVRYSMMLGNSPTHPSNISPYLLYRGPFPMWFQVEAPMKRRAITQGWVLRYLRSTIITQLMLPFSKYFCNSMYAHRNEEMKKKISTAYMAENSYMSK